MKVSGIAVLTRKALVTREHGAEAWRGFYRDAALSLPAFQSPITAESRVPLGDFLAFHDRLMARFYPGGNGALSELGAASARWALVEGPLKSFLGTPDLPDLAQALPELWNRYFSETESRLEATLTRTGIELRAYGLPTAHPYFEHLVIGYAKEVLEIHCANPISVYRLASTANADYAYSLTTDPIPYSPRPGRARFASRRRRELTLRELEVLRLVGLGKTNREIALLLRISPKTVQHHVAHAYDKVGVSSRAGATLWLAEQGLAIGANRRARPLRARDELRED
ncbi:MAG: LuxR C-terminal-related transcriptional regulator [Pseudomonadota bacterium]